MNTAAAATAEQVKRQLADAGLVLAGLSPGEMTDGHISARDPDRPAQFFIKPRGVGFNEMAPHNILTLDPAGDVVAGPGEAPAAAFIHAGIYGARPDVRAVIYSRAAQLVALSAGARSIRPFNHAGATFLNALPLYGDGIGSHDAAQGEAVAAALGPHRAVLLRSHGIVMTGRRIEEAVILLYMLDNAAEMQLRIEAAEAAEPDFPADEIETIRRNMLEERQFAVNFDYLVRQARRALQ